MMGNYPRWDRRLACHYLLHSRDDCATVCCVFIDVLCIRLILGRVVADTTRKLIMPQGDDGILAAGDEGGIQTEDKSDSGGDDK